MKPPHPYNPFQTNTPDLHSLGSSLLGTSSLGSLALHATHSLLGARSHQQEHHHSDNDNHHHHDQHNHHHGHAEARSLLPLAILLTQHTRSLLRAHVAALQSALVHRHLAHVRSLEHILRRTVALAHRDGDHHVRFALRVLGFHGERRRIQQRDGLAGDLTRLLVQCQTGGQRCAALHVEASDDVLVARLAAAHLRVHHELHVGVLVRQLLGQLVLALVVLHIAQHTIVALSVRVTAEAVGALRRRDLTLAHRGVVANAGARAGAGGLAVLEHDSVDAGRGGGDRVNHVAELREARNADRHGPRAALSVVHQLARLRQRAHELVALPARVDREAERLHVLVGLQREAVPLGALQVLHRPRQVRAHLVVQRAVDRRVQAQQLLLAARVHGARGDGGLEADESSLKGITTISMSFSISISRTVRIQQYDYFSPPITMLPLEKQQYKTKEKWRGYRFG